MARSPNLKQLDQFISEFIGEKKKEVKELPLWKKKFDFPSMAKLVGIETTNKMWNWKGFLSGKDKPIAPTTEDLMGFMATTAPLLFAGEAIAGPMGISRREGAKQFVGQVKKWNKAVLAKKYQPGEIIPTINIGQAKQALKAFSKAPKGFYDPVEKIEIKQLEGAKARHIPGERQTYNYSALPKIPSITKKGKIELDPQHGIEAHSILHEGIHGRQFQPKAAEGKSILTKKEVDISKKAMTTSDRAYMIKKQIGGPFAKQIWQAIPVERHADFLAQWIMEYPGYMEKEEGKIPTKEEFRKVFWETLEDEISLVKDLEDLGVDLGPAGTKETK